MFFCLEWTKCGNGIVEVDEECDEGSASLCCNDQCNFLPNATCSPFNSLCCTMECMFKKHEKIIKQNATTLNFNNSVPSTACIPWNYCPDLALFCIHEQHFCPIEEIKINCNVFLTPTTQNSTTSYLLTNGASSKTSTSTSTTTFTLISSKTENASKEFNYYIISLIIGAGLLTIFSCLSIWYLFGFKCKNPRKRRPTLFCQKRKTVKQSHSSNSNDGEDSPDLPLPFINKHNKINSEMEELKQIFNDLEKTYLQFKNDCTESLISSQLDNTFEKMKSLIKRINKISFANNNVDSSYISS